MTDNHHARYLKTDADGVIVPEPPRIFLLDLNYTLAIRDFADKRGYRERWKDEQYRQWLVELLRPEYVILITARPTFGEKQTMQRIKAQCGWLPQRQFFNPANEQPHDFKLRTVRDLIMPEYGADPNLYFGIESNKMTRAAYASIGIDSAPIPENGVPWTKIPPRSVQKVLPPPQKTLF